MQNYMYKEFIAVKLHGIRLLSRADFITKNMPTPPSYARLAIDAKIPDCRTPPP